MEKKINLRALMQERMKALKEGKLVKSDKPLELPKRMKELMERAKLARGEQGSTEAQCSEISLTKITRR